MKFPNSFSSLLPPAYLTACIDKTLLCEWMEDMLETIARNIDRGYQIDIDIVSQYVQHGMTLETFNMLVLNLNKELNTQFENGGLYCQNDKQVTIH